MLNAQSLETSKPMQNGLQWHQLMQSHESHLPQQQAAFEAQHQKQVQALQ